jgi:hypothetical protein
MSTRDTEEGAATRLAGDLSRDDLVALVAKIQRILFRREVERGGSRIGYFDADKEFTDVELCELVTALAAHQLVPPLRTYSPGWDARTLYYCARCSFAWDEMMVRRLTGNDLVDWLANAGELGFCPRCGARCWPIPAAALTDAATAPSEEGSGP